MSTKREAWHPPSFDRDGKGHPNTYTKADIRALQALAQGEAGEGDQKRALDWIINHACLTYDEPFRPGQTDVSAYLMGRRAAGMAIVKLLKLKPEILDKERD